MDIVKQEKTPHRWKKGESGNPNGRPPKPEIKELRDALKLAQEKNNKSFLQHYVNRAFISDKVAVALANKILPDLQKGEGYASSLTAISINRSSDDKIRSRFTPETV